MQEWKNRERTAWLKNAGVENAGVDRRVGKCRSGKSRNKPVWKAKPKKINRVAAHILNVIQQSAIHEALHQCYLCDADAVRRAGPSEAAAGT